MKLLKCEKGQVSAELLIIIAALVAVAVILVTQLGDTASKGADRINNKSDDLFKKIDKIEPTNYTATDATE